MRSNAAKIGGSAPRTCGDEPKQMTDVKSNKECAPHLRG